MVELIEKALEKFDKTILIVGVFHGDEPQGEFLIREFLKEINFLKLKNKLIFIPCLNKDGKKLNQRQNVNGVDLNRNFPTKNWKLTSKDEFYGGNKPNSENETQFMVNLIEKYAFDAIFSLHAPFEIVNYDGPAEKIALKISEITGYKVQEDIGYPTCGSFGTYCGIERNIPTITLELPENTSNQALYKINKPVFEYFAYEF